jgi:DEAD/DEAH box helicase domain-containing protein
MANVVFFDLETQRSFQEVGGRSNLRMLGLSVGVTHSSASESYHDYLEDDADALVAELMAADTVVGFNVLSFDYEVLRAYTDQPLETIPTVDMLAHIHDKLGFRVSLDNLAGATLGAAKSADGLQAIRWYREGEIQKIVDYCRQDVNVTRQLYEHGREHGNVSFLERSGRLRRVRVSW